MDEMSLKLYGLGTCRRSLALKLKSKAFSVIQIIFIVLYLLTVIAYFIILDLTLDDRISEHLAERSGMESEAAVVIQV